MTATEAHPPTHVLAELAEGVLDDATAREVQAHVDGCATCRATLDELAQVTVALQALPAELPVPEFVAARISHALAAERASGPGAAPGSSGSDDGTVAWFRRRLPQGLAAAASVAVLGLAGYIAVDGSGGSDADTSSAEDAAAAGSAEQPVPSTLGEDGDDRRLGTSGSSATTEYDTPSGPSALDEELATPNDISLAELTAAVEQVVQNPTATPAFCGEVLADELGLPRVGTANVGAGVLVVLDNTTAYDGWLLKTCNSRSNEAIVPAVSVPKAE